jgi:hypothetical protein
VRAIVNATEIYELPELIPVIIPCTKPVTAVIIGNGFHFSRLLEVKNVPNSHFFYQVECLIDDIRLGYLLFLTLLFFGMYILTDMRLFMIIANIPTLYFLFVFYFLRKSLILITVVGKTG